MKRQRLLTLSVVFLIPLTLLAVLIATAALAGPATTSYDNPAEFLPSAASDGSSIVAMRAISIPYAVDNFGLTPSTGGQIVAMRVISVPFTADNFAVSSSTGSQIVAMRAISIPYAVDNFVLPSSTVSPSIVAMRAISIPFMIDNSLIVGS